MLRKHILPLENKNMLLPQVKNIFASRAKILLAKHMLPKFSHHGSNVDWFVKTLFP